MMYFLNKLILENGILFSCNIINKKNVFGEFVFNTSNYGYIELISDPSYKSQFLVLSNPHIGNTGVILQDCQSFKIYLNAVIINNYSISSNFRSNFFLNYYLKKKKIPLISNIDTRKLIHIIKTNGTLIGFLPKKKVFFNFIIKYLRSLKLFLLYYD